MLEYLDNGEKLVIWRRRRGWTQSFAAATLHMSYAQYSKWERDLEEFKIRVEHPEAAEITASKLKAHEKCFIYRRRCRKTQAEVAAELGCCRWWVNQMERGVVPCDELVWYWEQ